MKVLLVDADSTIPNLALMKLSMFHKRKGDEITLLQLHIPYYPRKKPKTYNIPNGFDKTYCSVVFDKSIAQIESHGVIFGGTGYSLGVILPAGIERIPPDYALYNEQEWSYGFISRGCIRNCKFCKVPQKEGWIRQSNQISDIVQHSKVQFLDNNILALPQHLDILQELVDKKIRCQFAQGLDMRLVDTRNSRLLSQLRYLGNYTFAFDDWRYLPSINRGLDLLSWRRDWQLRFYVYCHPDMSMDNITQRIEYLRDRQCLPYIMRDRTCFESENSDFYVDIASYCNQPGIFKNMTFKEFLPKRHKSKKAPQRIKRSEALYYNNQEIK